MVSTLAPVLALALDKGELAEELRELYQRLVTAEETERYRIAADLHDGPLQQALVLATHLNMPGEARATVARQVVWDLREIGARLRPAILDDLGLPSALDWLLEHATRGSAAMHTQLSVAGIDEDERFSGDIELAMFRVAQEGITNAIKHSMGSSVTVRLAREGDALIMEVADDGQGIPPDLGPRQGFGLYGMRERMLQVGGLFKVVSSPGRGVTVWARVPLPHSQRVS